MTELNVSLESIVEVSELLKNQENLSAEGYESIKHSTKTRESIQNYPSSAVSILNVLKYPLSPNSVE